MENGSLHKKPASSLEEIGPLFLLCKALQNHNKLVNAQSIAESKEESLEELKRWVKKLA